MTIATQEGRRMIERLQAEPFAQVFARYNDDPADDPGGAGTGPGADFDVSGFTAWTNDADGLAGEIVLPTTALAPGVLREDVVDTSLGMPRDLNGDGVVDANDHSSDYRLLPVLVRIRWQNASGRNSVEFKTMLGEFL